MAKRVLIAFDKFKDAISAERACSIVGREIRRVRPDWRLASIPLTDGGEGFCRILTRAADGELIRVPATGPRLESRMTEIGLVASIRLPAGARDLLLGAGASAPKRIVVVEMAAASGLALVPPAERNPWRTTSFGTGQLLRAAAELRADFILLGVGGSATSDLGLGALNAVGLDFRDARGGKIKPPFPEAWERIERISGAIFEALPPIAIACDVDNPLLGPTGAAAVFGPQKGLPAGDLGRFDAEAERMARALCAFCGVAAETAINDPGAGAAGGISFGLKSATGARLVPGFDLFSEWLDIATRLDEADIVITGEGRFDQTSLDGKGPGTLVQRARGAGKSVFVFAGSVADGLAGPDTIQISPAGVPLARALADTERNLAAAVGSWLERAVRI